MASTASFVGRLRPSTGSMVVITVALTALAVGALIVIRERESLGRMQRNIDTQKTNIQQIKTTAEMAADTTRAQAREAAKKITDGANDDATKIVRDSTIAAENAYKARVTAGEKQRSELIEQGVREKAYLVKEGLDEKGAHIERGKEEKARIIAQAQTVARAEAEKIRQTAVDRAEGYCAELQEAALSACAATHTQAEAALQRARESEERANQLAAAREAELAGAREERAAALGELPAEKIRLEEQNRELAARVEELRLRIQQSDVQAREGTERVARIEQRLAELRPQVAALEDRVNPPAFKVDIDVRDRMPNANHPLERLTKHERLSALHRAGDSVESYCMEVLLPKIARFSQLSRDEQVEVLALLKLPLGRANPERGTVAEAGLKLHIALYEFEQRRTAELHEARSLVRLMEGRAAPRAEEPSDELLQRLKYLRHTLRHTHGVKMPVTLPRPGCLGDVVMRDNHVNIDVGMGSIPVADPAIDLNKLMGWWTIIQSNYSGAFAKQISGMNECTLEQAKQRITNGLPALINGRDGRLANRPNECAMIQNILRHYVVYVEQELVKANSLADEDAKRKAVEEVYHQMVVVYANHIATAFGHCGDRLCSELQKIYLERIAGDLMSQGARRPLSERILRFLALKRTEIFSSVIDSCIQSLGGDLSSNRRAWQKALAPRYGLAAADALTGHAFYGYSPSDQQAAQVKEMFDQQYCGTAIVKMIYQAQKLEKPPFTLVEAVSHLQDLYLIPTNAEELRDKNPEVYFSMFELVAVPDNRKAESKVMIWNPARNPLNEAIEFTDRLDDNHTVSMKRLTPEGVALLLANLGEKPSEAVSEKGTVMNVLDPIA